MVIDDAFQRGYNLVAGSVNLDVSASHQNQRCGGLAWRVGWLNVWDVFVKRESETIVKFDTAYGLGRIRVFDFK